MSLWELCGLFVTKHSRTSGSCVTTMRWTLNTRKISGPKFILSGLKIGAFVCLRGRRVKLGRTYTAVASKQRWTNVTGTTTGTINTAVVPLTMSLSWHSGPVWWCWKRKWILSHLWKTRRTGESSSDLTHRTWLGSVQVKDPHFVSRLCQNEAAALKLVPDRICKLMFWDVVNVLFVFLLNRNCHVWKMFSERTEKGHPHICHTGNDSTLLFRPKKNQNIVISY